MMIFSKTIVVAGVVFLLVTDSNKVSADALAIAFCSEEIKSIAPTRADTASKAERRALQTCRAFGGTAGCCEVVVSLDDDSEENCIAVAVAGDGNFGKGTGATQLKAGSAAMADCTGSGCEIKSQICRLR